MKLIKTREWLKELLWQTRTIVLAHLFAWYNRHSLLCRN